MSKLDEIAARSANTRLCQQADCDQRECQTDKDRAVLVAAVRSIEALAAEWHKEKVEGDFSLIASELDCGSLFGRDDAADEVDEAIRCALA